MRKVSLGKVGKPKLRSIKSGEGLDQEDRESQELNEVPPLPTELNSGAWRSGAVGSEAPKASTESSTFYNPPTPGDALPTPSLMAPSSTPSSGNASPVAPLDPRINQILGSLEKGGAIGTGSTTSPHAPSPEPSEQIKGAKRPPRLNLAVTKDPEVRGSSSSLPELIRRATKLASNLDRGKTASRVGLLNILEAKEKERSPKASREGSISDILAAFPSPSLATPTGERPGSRWPSPLPKSGLAKDQSALDSPTFDENHQRRRCCGMPFWAFILLCIILILLVAAAVIIPVTLVVLPRQSHNVPDEGWEACKKSNPCAHGGTSVFINKQCRCVCSGGFLGAACEIVADSECTNTEITTPDQPTMTFKDATVASNIPRLFQGAQSNFSLLSAHKACCRCSLSKISLVHRKMRLSLLTARLHDEEAYHFFRNRYFQRRQRSHFQMHQFLFQPHHTFHTLYPQPLHSRRITRECTCRSRSLPILHCRHHQVNKDIWTYRRLSYIQRHCLCSTLWRSGTRCLISCHRPLKLTICFEIFSFPRR